MVTNISIRDYKLFERGEKLVHPIVKVTMDEMPCKAMVFDLADYIESHSNDFRIMSAEFEYVVRYGCVYAESKFNNNLNEVTAIMSEIVEKWKKSLEQ